MGRIKTRLAKSVSTELLENYGDEFTTNFEENKEKVAERMTESSKKLRNIIAGYVTRMKKSGQ